MDRSNTEQHMEESKKAHHAKQQQQNHHPMERTYQTAIATLTISSPSGTTVLAAGQQVTVPITKTKTIIGRFRPACDIVFENEATLSKQHAAVIVTASGHVFIEDMGSTNGTFLLTEPPLQLEPHVRYQWRAPSVESVALGGLGKLVLSISTVHIPDDAEATVRVPPTLVESAVVATSSSSGDVDSEEDDDVVPPPPAAIFAFERRKSHPDVSNAKSDEDATKLSPLGEAEKNVESEAASAVVVAPLVAGAVDLDATLDYDKYTADYAASVPKIVTSSPAATAVAVPIEPTVSVLPMTLPSSSLASFVASPPVLAVVNESTTPSKTHHAEEDDDDDDETPPPPTSLIRRRNTTAESDAPLAASAAVVGHLLEVSPATKLQYQDTLDVTGCVSSFVTSTSDETTFGLSPRKSPQHTTDSPTILACPNVSPAVMCSITSETASPSSTATGNVQEKTKEDEESCSVVKKRTRAASEELPVAAVSPPLTMWQTSVGGDSDDGPKLRKPRHEPSAQAILSASSVDDIVVEGGSVTAIKKRARAPSHEEEVDVPLPPRAAAPEIPEKVARSVKHDEPPKQRKPPQAASVSPLESVAASPPPPSSPPLARQPKTATIALPVVVSHPSAVATPVAAAAVVPTAKWQFKVDLRKANHKDDAWDNYPDSDSATIEAAYTLYTKAKEAAAAASGKKAAVKKSLQECKLNATYGVHFDDMVQFRYDDRSRQRPVRRKTS